MKSPTWPQVALVAVMCAAIILSHVFAPPVVGAVTSIISTLVGAFFIRTGREEEKPPAPVLSLVKEARKEDES